MTLVHYNTGYEMTQLVKIVRRGEQDIVIFILEDNRPPIPLNQREVSK